MAAEAVYPGMRPAGRSLFSMPNAMLTRRRLLGAAVATLCASAGGGAMAQISDWSDAEQARFFAFRRAFGEYGDLSDREFARRMEALFSSLDSNPDADVVVAEVSRRLPEYQDVPRRRMQREMVSLFRKARQHFQR